MRRLGNRAIKTWVTFIFCITLGFWGAHKFYERKTGMGILYLLTFGLGGIGVIVDTITIFLKPNPYCVHWKCFEHKKYGESIMKDGLFEREFDKI